MKKEKRIRAAADRETTSFTPTELRLKYLDVNGKLLSDFAPMNEKEKAIQAFFTTPVPATPSVPAPYALDTIRLVRAFYNVIDSTWRFEVLARSTGKIVFARGSEDRGGGDRGRKGRDGERKPREPRGQTNTLSDTLKAEKRAAFEKSKAEVLAAKAAAQAAKKAQFVTKAQIAPEKVERREKMRAARLTFDAQGQKILEYTLGLNRLPKLKAFEIAKTLNLSMSMVVTTQKKYFEMLREPNAGGSTTSGAATGLAGFKNGRPQDGG